MDLKQLRQALLRNCRPWPKVDSKILAIPTGHSGSTVTRTTGGMAMSGIVKGSFGADGKGSVTFDDGRAYRSTILCDDLTPSQPCTGHRTELWRHAFVGRFWGGCAERSVRPYTSFVAQQDYPSLQEAGTVSGVLAGGFCGWRVRQWFDGRHAKKAARLADAPCHVCRRGRSCQSVRCDPAVHSDMRLRIDMKPPCCLRSGD